MDEQFWNAVKSGDMAAVKQRVDADPTCASARLQGVSGILLAMYYGQKPVAQYLADHSASLDVFEATAVGRIDSLQALLAGDSGLANAVSPDGFQPLGYAAFFGQPEAARLLLRAGAEVNSASRNSFNVMPLHSAAAGKHFEIVRMLVERGADVNAAQQAGFRPLHELAKSGDIEMVKLLVAHGADPKLANDEGLDSIDMARSAGHNDIVAYFESL